MSPNGRWRSNLIAGAATIHEGRFLLLQRSGHESFLPNVWGIPAGQARPGEDPSDACLRELFEETGLHGKVLDFINYKYYVSHRGDVDLGNVQLNFLVHVEDRDVKLDPMSHSEYRWISLDAVDDDVLDDFTRNIMIAARKQYEGTQGY